MILALEGLIAGAAHVVTGPDHMVGVAPLAATEAANRSQDGELRRIRPWLVGATWGVGHGAGVAVLGTLGQTLLSATQVELASGWSERLVGALLILLGVQAVRRAKGFVVHEHRHRHGDDSPEHVHLHVHQHGHDGLAHGIGDQHRHAALGMGLVHGLAGAGHFWAVLPSLAMGRGEAATYILSYIVSSIILMTMFGALIGRITTSIGLDWMPRFFRSVGAITIAVGAAWLALTFR